MGTPKVIISADEFHAIHKELEARGNDLIEARKEIDRLNQRLEWGQKFEEVGRFEDSFELFGGGCGSGCGYNLVCQLCGTVHNADAGYDSSDLDGHAEGDTVSYTHFAGLQIADCCFGRIEEAVLHRMPQILEWYARILEKRRANLEKSDELLNKVIKGEGNA
jgi:hypothetical protein